MGMSDQYDDGRYDSRDEYGHVIESPGGWRVPASQKPGWPFDRYYPDGILAPPPRLAHTSIGYVPITAVRGGIKYPKPKEAPMPESKKQELTRLIEFRELMGQQVSALNNNIDKLKREIEAEKFPAPPAVRLGEAFSIKVRYRHNRNTYRFLILRNGGAYFTTGRTGDNGYFPTWHALVRYLRSDDVKWHSAMMPLDTACGVRHSPLPEWGDNVD